jgi:hypothetical protein
MQRACVGDIIQSLWIGDCLTLLERLSLKSFLNQGHQYHLYTYSALKNVPEGVVLRDANEILSSGSIFQYRDYASYAPFANHFRYKLLYERGGWWADTDVVCIRPFISTTDHILATERDVRGREVITNGVIYAAKGSQLMESARESCEAADIRELRWGETGPTLLHNLALRLGMGGFAKPHEWFCPVDPHRWLQIVTPTIFTAISKDTLAVHLWNEMWRRNGLDKNEEYAPKSLYEELKRIYL